MNRQIRQLAVGLMVCYVVLFVALNYWQVGRSRSSTPRSTTPGRSAASSTSRAARSSPPTASSSPSRSPTPPGSDVHVPARSTPPATVRRRHRLLHVRLRRDELERTQNDVLTGDDAEQQLRNLRHRHRRRRHRARSRMTMRDDLQQVAKDALGEREGSVVVHRTRRPAPCWRCTATRRYDPNLVVDPDFDAARRRARRSSRTTPGDPLLANAYQQRYMPGSTFKVLTTGIALENGVVDLVDDVPRRAEWMPPQTNDPIQNYDGTSVRRRPPRGVHAQLQHPVRPDWRVELGVDGMVAGRGDWGVGEPIPIDLPRPAASTFGRRRRPRPEPAAAGDPRLRPERGPDGAAAHGDGRRRPSPTAGR